MFVDFMAALMGLSVEDNQLSIGKNVLSAI